MEELLNKLIERWWKPFGWKDIKRINNEWSFVCFVQRPWLSEVSHRELVSKESWLWQFVCENGLYEKKEKCRFTYEDEFENINYHQRLSYEYRLIKSALTNESELEEFLLSNIVIKDEE